MREMAGEKIKKNPADVFFRTAGFSICFFFPKVSNAFPQDYAVKLTLKILLIDDLQQIIICYRILFSIVFSLSSI